VADPGIGGRGNDHFSLLFIPCLFFLPCYEAAPLNPGGRSGNLPYGPGLSPVAKRFFVHFESKKSLLVVTITYTHITSK